MAGRVTTGKQFYTKTKEIHVELKTDEQENLKDRLRVLPNVKSMRRLERTLWASILCGQDLMKVCINQRSVVFAGRL